MTLVDKKQIASAKDIIARIEADLAFPHDKKAASKWAIAAACRWSEHDPALMPFTAKAMKNALLQASPGKSGMSRKTLQNARSAVEYVLRYYGQTVEACFTSPMSAECVTWWAQFNKYQRASLAKLLRYISWRGLTLREVDDEVGASFFAALDADLPDEKARSIYEGALLTWNKIVQNNVDWPGQHLKRLTDGKIAALTWSALPGTLLEAVDALFAHRNAGQVLFESQDRRRLKPTTIRNRKEHLRIVASLLCRAHGIGVNSLVGLADLCRPDRFKLIISTLVERRNGKVTGYVEQISITLLQAAEEGECLSPSEIDEVRKLKRKVYWQRQLDRKTEVHPDQGILNELDDEASMNRLLTLAIRTASRTLRGGKKDARAALKFQLATAFSIMLSAPLRISNFAGLKLDTQIQKIVIGGATRYIIRVPSELTKNGKPIEHFLDDEAVALLETYLREYRPLLATADCLWLWPGYRGQHKHPHVLSRQLAAFVKEEGGIKFHPHLIRKIAVKVILDSNPAGIEIARLLLGHSDTRPTLSAYAQSQVRSADTEYKKALLEKRLGAMASLSKGRTVAPAPLKVGKVRKIRAGGTA